MFNFFGGGKKPEETEVNKNEVSNAISSSSSLDET